MIEVVGIIFKNGGKVYYFSPGKYKLKPGITVIVETEQGTQFGKVVEENKQISSNRINSSLKKVLRIATKNDYNKHLRNIEDAKETLSKCKDLVEKYNLNMQIIEATYTFDRNQLIFRFISDNRVDFRNLVKDLAAIYKTRIELRQVGVRDRAKEIGGCGICGQKLCCSRYLNDLDSVSINMAKNQNISLNPTKINGVCGRLLCCLKYEDDLYSKYRQDLPEVGDKIKKDGVEGTVISLDIPRRKYTILTEDSNKVEILVPFEENNAKRRKSNK